MKPKNSVRLDRTVGRAIYPLHRWIYSVTGGRVGNTYGGRPIMLLTTTGCTTGRARTKPLLFFPVPDTDDFIVVASNGGRPENPDWYGNLLADPVVQLQIINRHVTAKARLAEPEERAELWPRLTAFYPGFAHYMTLTDRVLPVVVLHPEG